MRLVALFVVAMAGLPACAGTPPPIEHAPPVVLATPPAPGRDRPSEPIVEVFVPSHPRLKPLRVLDDGSVQVAGHRAGKLVAKADGRVELVDVDWRLLYEFEAHPGSVIFRCDLYFHFKREPLAIVLGLGGRVLEVDDDGFVSDGRGVALGQLQGVTEEHRWLLLALVLAARYAQDRAFRASVNAAMAGAPC
jgi:hypothetical protein